MKIKKSRAIQHIHTHDTYMYNAYIDVHGYRGTFSFHIWMENRPFGCVAHEVFDAELKSDRIRLYWDYFTLQTLFIRHFLAGDVFYLIIIYAFISLWIFFFKISFFCSFQCPNESYQKYQSLQNIPLYSFILLFFSSSVIRSFHLRHLNVFYIWWHFTLDLWCFFF